jgi:hypothetical protein
VIQHGVHESSPTLVVQSAHFRTNAATAGGGASGNGTDIIFLGTNRPTGWSPDVPFVSDKQPETIGTKGKV